MHCKNCGVPVEEGARFCASCGQPTSGSAPPTAPTASLPPQRRRLWLPVLAAALILALVGMGLGLWLLSGDDDGEGRASGTDDARTSTTAPSSSTVASNTTTTSATTTTTLPPLAVATPVTLTGIGPVRVGMTVEEAEQAARVELRAEEPAEPDCQYVSPAEGPDGLSFMVTNGTIARVDVYRGRVRTRSGVGIGSTEQEVMATYPGQIEVSTHPYDETGHYLTFLPGDASDASYRLILETDGRAVTSFRSGRLPEVEWIEGCS